MTAACNVEGETVLTGPVVDQAALFGVLARVRDLGLTLISVNRVENHPGERKDSDGRGMETGGFSSAM